MTLPDGQLQFAQAIGDVRISQQPRPQLVEEVGMERRDRLLLAKRGTVPGVGERSRPSIDQLQQLLDAVSGQSGACDDFGLHVWVLRSHKVECRSVVGDGVSSEIDEGAIGLVDCHDVREFHDSSFDALEIVAASGSEKQEEQIGEVGGRGLRLANANGLHDHEVEARSLADQEGFPGPLADTAKHAA